MRVSGWRAQSPTILLTAVLLVGVRLAYEPGPFVIDTVVMDWVATHRVESLVPTVSAVSEFFGPVLVTVWTAVIAVVLLWRDHSINRALTVIVGVVGAAMITEMFKLLVSRPRPPMRYHPGITEMTYSYPSGHVTGTAALALTTGLVLTSSAAPALRRLAVSGALFLTALAAGTRLYLGVHWISDVIAALAVASAAALLAPRLVHACLVYWHKRFPDQFPSWRRSVDAKTKESVPHVH